MLVLPILYIYQGVCWYSLYYIYIREYAGTPYIIYIPGSMLVLPILYIYQGVCWCSLYYIYTREYAGTPYIIYIYTREYAGAPYIGLTEEKNNPKRLYLR